MPIPEFQYPLDLYGTSIDNRVDNEEYVIGSVRRRIFIPNGGPFFGNSVSLVDLETGQPLIPRDDYILLHDYEEARDRTGQPVYAGVKIRNPLISDRIGFTAQYVGGEFGFSYAALTQAVIELQNDDRPVKWGDLIGLPSTWVPTPHFHDLRDTYRWNSMVNAQRQLADAIREGDVASHSLLVDTLTAQLEVLQIYKDELTTTTDDFMTNMSAEWNSFKTAIPMPVGMTYIQFIGHPPPSELFAGTWTKLMDGVSPLGSEIQSQAWVRTL